jgi:DNA-binding CsgD family transcriptional regulator
VIPWNTLTESLDELDAIRAQVRESRGLERTARFYTLIRIKQIGTEHGGHVAHVIELNAGWVIMHWLADPKSICFYQNIHVVRKAFCTAGVYLLSLDDSSDQKQQIFISGSGPALTDRERLVLRGLGHGMSNKEISTELGIATPTIKNICTVLFRKLEVVDRTQAALIARDLDLFPRVPDSHA